MLAQLYREVAGLVTQPPEPVRLKESRALALNVGGAGFAAYADPPRNLADWQATYESLVMVYRCARLNASTVSSGNLRFYRAKGESKTYLPETHPLARLFRDREDLEFGGELSLWLTGNMYWELDRAREFGPVGDIQNLNSVRMEVKPGPSRPSGYRLTVNSKQIEYRPDEVYHDTFLNPNNDWYGIPPLGPATRTLASDELLEKQNVAILRNQARLSGVMSMEPDTDDELLKDAIETFKSGFTGVDNAGKVLFLVGGRKFERFQLTSQELQAFEMRASNRDDVMIAFGITKFVYGITDESATYENAATQWGMYMDGTVSQEARRFAGSITRRLIPLLNIPMTQDVIAEYDLSEHEFYKERRRKQDLADLERRRVELEEIRAGKLTVNESREAEGKRPVAWGGTWYQPLGLVPVGQSLATQQARMLGDAMTEVKDAVKALLPAPAVTKLPPLPYTVCPSTHDGFSCNRTEPYHKRHSDGLIDWTDDTVSKLPPLPPKEGDVLASIGAGKLERDHPEILRMLKVFAKAVKDGATEALATIGIDIDYDPDTGNMLQWLRQKTIQFADATWDTYSERLRGQLLEGMAEGENIQDLRRRVDVVFDKRKDNALTVARTEVAGTANRGAMDAYQQAGLQEHEWLSARDEEVRPSHQAIDSEVRHIGQPFSNGLKFPGDTSTGDVAEFANCRCSVLGVVPGVERSIDVKDAIWKRFDNVYTVNEKRIASQFIRITERQTERILAALSALS